MAKLFIYIYLVSMKEFISNQGGGEIIINFGFIYNQELILEYRIVNDITYGDGDPVVWSLDYVKPLHTEVTKWL